jgi:hypothetical protein
MTIKSKQYSEAIISSSLRLWHSSLAYNSYYMVSLLYGTAAPKLNVKECEEIQRPVVNAILPKIGVNRNTSRHVVFNKCGGLGFNHLVAVQVFAQLQYLIETLHTQDTTGDLCQMLLDILSWSVAEQHRFWRRTSLVRTDNFDQELDHGVLEVPLTVHING